MSDDTKNEVETIFSSGKYGFYLILFYLCVEFILNTSLA